MQGSDFPASLILLSLHLSHSPAAFKAFITQCFSLGFIFFGNLSVGLPRGHFQTSSELEGLGFVFLVATSNPSQRRKRGLWNSSLLPVSGRACVYFQSGTEMVFHLSPCFGASVIQAGFSGYLQHQMQSWLLSHFGINPKSSPFQPGRVASSCRGSEPNAWEKKLTEKKS